ncbi:MAG: hypothetical protein Q7P63_00100 [Verrucomicrobiota bacterium JB022]|nr:hypothetical protein [Verrucomicrobiota bacterium JB022]
MKHIEHLHPEFREQARALLSGFVEHCEFSRTLVGDIRHFIHFGGRKYGLPIFTVFGPPHPDLETHFIGLVGHNQGRDTTLPEILMQLIERLALQPRVATGTVLRVLPVADPVGFEGDAAASPELAALLDRQIDAFHTSALDGVVSIRTSTDDALHVKVAGPSPVRQAVRRSWDALDRLLSEDTIVAEGASLRLLEAPAEGPWEVEIAVPRSWASNLAVHWISQLLVVFLRAHAEAQLHALPELAE